MLLMSANAAADGCIDAGSTQPDEIRRKQGGVNV
jgi:hypothetical protein